MHFRGAEVKSMVGNFVPPLNLTLKREPDNAYDANAIQVFYGDVHIGYVEGPSAAFIAPKMDSGAQYTCTVEFMEPRRNNLHPICTIAPKV
jgi:hypothetical protein